MTPTRSSAERDFGLRPSPPKSKKLRDSETPQQSRSSEKTESLPETTISEAASKQSNSTSSPELAPVETPCKKAAKRAQASKKTAKKASASPSKKAAASPRKPRTPKPRTPEPRTPKPRRQSRRKWVEEDPLKEPLKPYRAIRPPGGPLQYGHLKPEHPHNREGRELWQKASNAVRRQDGTVIEEDVVNWLLTRPGAILSKEHQWSQLEAAEKAVQSMRRGTVDFKKMRLRHEAEEAEQRLQEALRKRRQEEKRPILEWRIEREKRRLARLAEEAAASKKRAREEDDDESEAAFQNGAKRIRLDSVGVN